jgi:UDPglucose--hexose-1-phosphate uridylyltransferase
MPELRQNLVTRDWVIIATERASRPNEFKIAAQRPPVPEHEKECPFCPGNEAMTGKEISRIGSGGLWRVRTIPNKYPAFAPSGERTRTSSGLFRSMSGVGIHEVIVDHPAHNMNPALFTDEQMTDVITMYWTRYAAVRKDSRIEAVVIFKNHGESAGTSLSHPHSQLAATPVVPTQVRLRMDEAIRHFDDTGECLFCKTLAEELEAKERIIIEGKYFVAFQPFAALSPFHTWIFPRRHMASFDDIADQEIPDLARVLRDLLAKLHFGLNDPDYNYTIRSIPTANQNAEYFHWYLTVIPRVSRTAGFEIGSGMYINTSLPEESARFLREVEIPKP